mmetsp:Transcript_55989/g.93271  ORF Transcript_55989/g.93271 Transcript_55989/m.93271 type:complete len:109 (-) Transcript_55989:97-423(-)
MRGILEILELSASEIRISNIDVIPLDCDGAPLDVYKSTAFDHRQLRRPNSHWIYFDTPLDGVYRSHTQEEDATAVHAPQGLDVAVPPPKAPFLLSNEAIDENNSESEQ